MEQKNLLRSEFSRRQACRKDTSATALAAWARKNFEFQNDLGCDNYKEDFKIKIEQLIGKRQDFKDKKHQTGRQR